MVCEWLDGGTVYDLLAAMRKLPLPLALELFAQLLEALAHAHQRGIVHRDLKPTNLLLSRSGSLKVGDFGIAKMPGGTMLTQTGVLMGTPAYMSPEQAMGRPVDARSDLYASGVVLYELLTGANPRHSDNPTVALAKVLGEELPQVYTLEPGAPAWVQPLLDRLLARAPEDRLASAQEVLAVVRENLAKFRRQYSGLVQACLADPKQMKQRLTHDRANEWFRRALRLSRGLARATERRIPALLHRPVPRPSNELRGLHQPQSDGARKIGEPGQRRSGGAEAVVSTLPARRKPAPLGALPQTLLEGSTQRRIRRDPAPSDDRRGFTGGPRPRTQHPRVGGRHSNRRVSGQTTVAVSGGQHHGRA